ncbi:hypothetical protein EP7_002825 [Isosphaeraceae bacterium EP7]
MRKSFKPAVDGLEHRVVLSSISTFFQNTKSDISNLVSKKSSTINGTLVGRYTVEKGAISDAGDTYTFSNLKGNLNKLGNSKGVGTVYSLGFVDKARAPGVLNITSNKGNVVLVLKGPEQVGFSPLPKTFKYVVSGGKGVGANFNSTGIVTLKLTPKGVATISIRADS